MPLIIESPKISVVVGLFWAEVLQVRLFSSFDLSFSFNCLVVVSRLPKLFIRAGNSFVERNNELSTVFHLFQMYFRSFVLQCFSYDSSPGTTFLFAWSALDFCSIAEVVLLGRTTSHS